MEQVQRVSMGKHIREVFDEVTGTSHYEIVAEQRTADVDSVQEELGDLSLDSGQQSDFLEEAHKLVDNGKAKSMTEAMKKVRRRQPELHEAFKNKSQPPRYPLTARQFENNKKYRALVEKYQLALDQADNAAKTGHESIAKGVYRKAGEILVEMRQLIREEEKVLAGK